MRRKWEVGEGVSRRLVYICSSDSMNNSAKGSVAPQELREWFGQRRERERKKNIELLKLVSPPKKNPQNTYIV